MPQRLSMHAMIYGEQVTFKHSAISWHVGYASLRRLECAGAAGGVYARGESRCTARKLDHQELWRVQERKKTTTR